MRRADPYQGMDEILQTDVMRFMAIIAICLIAILALVRGVEPGSAAAVAPPAALTRPLPPATRPAPEPVRPDRVVPARQAPPSDPKPAAVAPAAPAPSVATAGPTPAPQPVAAADPTPGAPQGPAQPGLTLRFASDQDFLRLVSRGRIQVYAFSAERILRVESGLSFAPAAAPSRLHELLPETIPALLTGALEASEGHAGFRWGIAMPERMARQVRDFVDGGASGELIIDRFGEVRLDAGA